MLAVAAVALVPDVRESATYLVGENATYRFQNLVLQKLWTSGDPLLFHAYGVVVCLGKDTSISGRDLIMWGRLGNSVHKTIILAMLQEDNQVHYLSLRWSGEL
ncbi:hypothetical protein HPB48_003978 [Haemaphysalis longicornis]|uniref:tRNA-intron lyase n=1 Tax=Haemaphysalis longicornis TaxID=44386 RepID=A0A9J6GHJ3_HAELO|nr:hypothetical protein HPB48_003978 [Haemaphysalis longicornis]